MQDRARFFAYVTWAMMVSLAIIIFTNRLIEFALEPGWTAILILLAFGFIYFNLTYAAIKRYIRKVPAPTHMHIVLALCIYLPPFAWIIAFNERYDNYGILILLVLALGCVIGTVIGNRAGIKARYEYVQKLKNHARKLEEEKRN